MATYTTNYNLTKPELADLISPTVFANNFDTIDSTLKTLDTEIQTVSESAGAGGQIFSTSYVGTGTYGLANPTSITFPFVPDLVIILESLNHGTINYRTDMIAFFNPSAMYTEFAAASEGKYAYLYKLWNETSLKNSNVYAKMIGNTMSWYTNVSSQQDRCQLNGNWLTYHVIAFKGA